MFCKNCGGEVNDNQAICLKCGVEVGKGRAFCHNCGKPVGEEAAVCLNCGVALKKELKEQAAKAQSPNGAYLNGQDKITMAILAFFLGGFGVHNFMMGEQKKGIFKLVTLCCCGLSLVFALIDFVKILCGSYVVDPNKLI